MNKLKQHWFLGLVILNTLMILMSAYWLWKVTKVVDNQGLFITKQLLPAIQHNIDIGKFELIQTIK